MQRCYLGQRLSEEFRQGREPAFRKCVAISVTEDRPFPRVVAHARVLDLDLPLCFALVADPASSAISVPLSSQVGTRGPNRLRS
jgi:hypothetical protein